MIGPDGFPVTQPVSGTFLTDTQLRAAPVIMTGAVTIENWPASFGISGTVAVTGTFWPSIQAVSQSGAWTVAVTGTFWQAVQPVSGPLTDAQLRANPVPISGAFWQATQPVSIASMPSTPVTGTFWPATQPISATTLPLPSGASTEATLAAIKAKTDNLDVALSTRTKPADTQPVSLVALPALAAGNAAIGKLAANDGVDIGDVTINNPSLPVTGTFWQATQPVSGPLTDTQLRASTVPVSGPLTDTQLRASAVAVLGPLTDVQLRANPVPVSGPLTDTQLRATPVPVSGFPTWPYPAAATPIAAQSAVIANAVASVTLAAAASKFTYLTALQIFGTGATASTVVLATITGLLGGTMTIPVVVPAGVGVALTPVILPFDMPLRSSAVNTAIVVSLPALGVGNLRATVNAQGFQQ